MTESAITCELVDEGDLDTRYLSGRLSPQEAEAFEAHFFGCERCWALVRQGLEIRSAIGVQDTSAAPALVSHPFRPTSRRWGLAAAAGIALAVAGVWWLGLLGRPAQPEDVLRGAESALVIVPGSSDTVLTASWPRLPQADVYRVRLYGADGTLVMERQTSDTVLSAGTHTISGVAPGSEIFWQVQALDRLRNTIARSDLTPVVLPDR